MTKYYKINPDPNDLHLVDYAYGAGITKDDFIKAKWYPHPLEDGFWCSVPEIFEGSNKFGFFFLETTTFTPINND